MIRNLRTLALAMGAVFLLGGLMASSASATAIWFEGEEGIQTVTGEDHPDITDVFKITNGASEVRCTDAHYTNLTSTVDTTESEIKVTPSYEGCTPGHTTVTPNGCDYRFYNPTTNTSGERTANVAITCPTGEVIEITSTLFGTFKCLVTVKEQTPQGHAVFTNTGAGATRDVTAKITLTGIHYTEHSTHPDTGETATGLGACTDPDHIHTGTDGTFDGGAIIKGQTHNPVVHKGVWID